MPFTWRVFGLSGRSISSASCGHVWTISLKMSMPSASKTFQTLQTCICFFWAIAFQVPRLSTFKALLAIHPTTDKRSLISYSTTNRKFLNLHSFSLQTKTSISFVVLRDLGTNKVAEEWLLSSFWHSKMAATLESYVNRILLLFF